MMKKTLMLIRRCALFAAIPANCRRENPDCPRRSARQYSIAELCRREDINTNGLTGVLEQGISGCGAKNACRVTPFGRPLQMR